MSDKIEVFQPPPHGNQPAQDGAHGDPPWADWQTALLCIDLQYLGCKEGYGVFENHRRAGVSEDAIHYYLDRVHDVVLPNVRKLQERFRERGYEVIHSHIQSLTEDGRDRSLEHKELGLHAPPGSRLAEFLPEVAPQGDEIVISKTASGVFVSTNLAYILRNLQVSELYIVGVYTNECVSSAVRSASDLGFKVTLIEDATAAITPDLHKATILTLRDRYARILSTTELLEQLQQSKKK